MKKTIALAAALSLVAAPAMAAPRAAAPASALSLAKSAPVRAAAPAKRGSRLSGGFLENPAVSVVIGAAAIAGILLVAGAVADDSDSN